MSSLSFGSKILEKVVSERLKARKTAEGLLEPFQSAYRAGYSTETSVVRLQNNILEAIDYSRYVFPVLVDISVAFESVSQDILLDRLRVGFGVIVPGSWIHLYLTNRSQSILISGIHWASHVVMLYHRALYWVWDFFKIIALQLHHWFSFLASRLIVMLMILSSMCSLPQTRMRLLCETDWRVIFLNCAIVNVFIDTVVTMT